MATSQTFHDGKSSFQDLFGQHALVTGAAGGIGMNVASALLERGARVTLHFHRTTGTLSELQQQYGDKRVRLQAVNAQEEVEVQKSVQEATEAFGTPNILVANHAIFSNEYPIWEMPLQQWQRTIDVDLTGYMLYVKHVTSAWKRHSDTLGNDQEALKRFNASIIMIGSTAGRFGEALHADYATVKGALDAFVMSVGNEITQLFPFARINVVSPGWTHTPMAKDAVATGRHLKSMVTMPMQKIATTQDVTEAVMFFASSRSSFHITKQNLVVAGGMEGRVQFANPVMA